MDTRSTTAKDECRGGRAVLSPVELIFGDHWPGRSSEGAPYRAIGVDGWSHMAIRPLMGSLGCPFLLARLVSDFSQTRSDLVRPCQAPVVNGRGKARKGKEKWFEDRKASALSGVSAAIINLRRFVFWLCGLVRHRSVHQGQPTALLSPPPASSALPSQLALSLACPSLP